MEFEVEKGLEESGGIFAARGLSSNAGGRSQSVASIVKNANRLGDD